MSVSVFARSYTYTAYSNYGFFHALIYQAQCDYTNTGSYAGNASIYKYGGSGSITYYSSSGNATKAIVKGIAKSSTFTDIVSAEIYLD